MFFKKHKDLDELKKAVEAPIQPAAMPEQQAQQNTDNEEIPQTINEFMVSKVSKEHSSLKSQITSDYLQTDQNFQENEHSPRNMRSQYSMPEPPSISAMVHNSLEKREELAPLFVKIEKYRELIASVQEVETFVAGIKKLFVILNEVEATRADAMNMLRTSVQRLEKSVEWVDRSLLKPIGFEELPHGEMEAKHIEHSLIDLQRELSSLRRELDKIP